MAMNVAIPAEMLRASVAASPLNASIVTFPALETKSEAMDSLLEGALSPNPVHGRLVLSAHAAAGLLPDRLRFIAVQDGSALEGLLPFLPGGNVVGWRRAHRIWMPPQFAVNATPLIGKARPQESAAALADLMAQAGALWRFPLFAVESAAGEALLAAWRQRGFATAVVSSFERAVLTQRPGGYEAYARRHLSANRRKGLSRQWRRLEKAGRVTVARFSEGEGLGEAVEAFLALEKRGWKGRRGTALGCDAASAAVGRALFAAGEAGARADVLSLDGRPVAVSLALLCGGTAFLLKTAHDEELREFSPGVLLEEAIMQAFLNQGFAEKLDSASLPGSLLEELFADRERIADLVVATDPRISTAALETMVARERRRKATLAWLKGWYWRAADALGRWRQRRSD
jgi:CelD/BcsL family acetyltransferase involved in cellulose biosynthesis